MLRPTGSHLRKRTRFPLLSLRLGVCHSKTRMYVRLLGPCFKTGRRKPFSQQSRISQETQQQRHFDGSSNTPNLRRSIGLTHQQRIIRMDAASIQPTVAPARQSTPKRTSPILAFSRESKWCWVAPRRTDLTTFIEAQAEFPTVCVPNQQLSLGPWHITGILRFPVSNFKHYLTLFSKFFSSFPHGTCSLSVSRRYLALDEIYHPISAAIPNNATRWTHLVRERILGHVRGCHPLCQPFPEHG